LEKFQHHWLVHRGTPIGYDLNSVTLAGFSANENGNFGYYDGVALEYLY
jgi:hypothetical protein